MPEGFPADADLQAAQQQRLQPPPSGLRGDLPRSEGTQRTGIGESLPGAPPAIGASAPSDPPREATSQKREVVKLAAEDDPSGVLALAEREGFRVMASEVAAGPSESEDGR